MAYNKTEEGATTYTELFGAVKRSLPQYLDEVRGMAEGAGIDFSTVTSYISTCTFMECISNDDNFILHGCSS